MLGIKKLDIFIVKSFLTLFLGTFLICLFIFMMQFLWRYIDELVGKGLEMEVLAQFFFYSAISLVPASLPLAVLLASLITFGNFGERYELLAMKAAGISLFKIMRPLIVFVALLCCISFFFQNVVGPKAEVKLWTLLISMKQKSPELDIPERVFYNNVIEGYNLYVKKKNRDTGVLYNVMIYNFSDGFENAHIILADSGRLEMTADKQHLYLHLYSGEMFENLKAQSSGVQNVPYRRESFREKHTIIEFNSQFNMVDASIMSNQSRSKNMTMLEASIDSMTMLSDSIGRSYYKEAAAGAYRPIPFLSKQDTLKVKSAHLGDYNVDSLFDSSTLMQKQRVLTSVVSNAGNLGSDWGFKSFNIQQNDQSIRKHKTEWHNKITLSLACLIFFFIGAPLGAIIRRGGLGMPVIVSVLIFIIYYIINNTGYKMARDGNWVVWMGMWTSTAVLAPLGAFLSYKSNKDSVVLNADAYISWFKRIAGIRSVRHLFRKEVVIVDPDYDRIVTDLSQLSIDCKAYIDKCRLMKSPNYIKLWMVNTHNEEIVMLNDRLEILVEEMSNSQSITLLNALNNYPVIAVHAHVRPFDIYWLNMLAGLLVPVGLFFYFRIWAFRVRLGNDINRIIKTNEEITTIIQTNL
nr:LptF/LptG family permease [uncultured Bacteroides sp.]